MRQCAPGIQRTEVRDVAEQPAKHRTVPITKDRLTLMVPRLRNPELNNGWWEQQVIIIQHGTVSFSRKLASLLLFEN